MSYMTPHTITYSSAIKYADDGSTVTVDLLALASLIPSEKGSSFYFPITIPRNIVPQPEFESDDELRKINKALTDLSFDLDRVWNVVKKLQGSSSSSSSSSSDSDYASSNESERFIETLPSPPPLRRQTAICE